MSEPAQADQTIVEIVDRISEIDAAAWDACANPSGVPANPFTSHAFLNALEASGSARPETGWYPQHLVWRDDGGKLAAVMPCYAKNHSQGEYVFDHGWADAYERAGGQYYPKLQCSVPFTPATGRRVLVRDSVDRTHAETVMAAALAERCASLNASSAHITFMTKSEWDRFGEAGYLQRIDQQFHWQNNGYDTFDNFLDALSSRKRKTIRRERKGAFENDIEIDWLTGSDITQEHWDAFFAFYMDTGSRKYGRPYLTRKFYRLIGETMAEKILLVMCRRGGRYIAGAINFIGGDTLYGRHWGCVEDHKFLHFEACYYQAIEFAITHKLGFVEAGAQGPHKLARGYVPVTTYSAHHLRDKGLRDAVEDYLQRERFYVSQETRALARYTPFKRGGEPGAQEARETKADDQG